MQNILEWHASLCFVALSGSRKRKRDIYNGFQYQCSGHALFPCCPTPCPPCVYFRLKWRCKNTYFNAHGSARTMQWHMFLKPLFARLSKNWCTTMVQFNLIRQRFQDIPRFGLKTLSLWLSEIIETSWGRSWFPPQDQWNDIIVPLDVYSWCRVPSFFYVPVGRDIQRLWRKSWTFPERFSHPKRKKQCCISWYLCHHLSSLSEGVTRIRFLIIMVIII